MPLLVKLIFMLSLLIQLSLTQSPSSSVVNVITPYNETTNWTLVTNNTINEFWKSMNIEHDACHPPNTALERPNYDTRKFYIQNSIQDTNSTQNLTINGIYVYPEIDSIMQPEILSEFQTAYPISIKPNESIAFNITYNCYNDQILKTGTNGWTYLIVNISLADTNVVFDYLKICTLDNMSRYDISLLLILCIAIIVVGIATRQSKTLLNEQGEQNDEIKPIHAILFIIIGSCALIIFYYFLDYIETILTIMISITSISSMTIVINEILDSITKTRFRFLHNTLKIPYYGMVSWTNIISLIDAIAIVLAWVISRNWILNNIIGLCIVSLVFKAIKIPSLKVATLLLGLAFFYDIFWVFMSKPIFGDSVMTAVASNLDLPIKIELPCIKDIPISRCTMLGLGDMALPGLFISFAFKFDKERGISRYYWASYIGYICGLMFCGVFLVVLEMAQPALLYIVPCTLGAVFGIALRKKEIKELWKGLQNEGEYKDNFVLTNDRSDANVIHVETVELSPGNFEMRRRDIRED